MDAENMREFKFRVQYELKDGSRVWLYSPTDVSNSHIFDLKNAGHRNRVTDVPEIVDGKRTGNDLVAAIIEESFGQWTGLKDKNGKEIYEGDVVRVANRDDDPVVEFREGVFGVEIMESVQIPEDVIEGQEVFYPLSDDNVRMGFDDSKLGLSGMFYALEVIGNIHDKEQA